MSLQELPFDKTIYDLPICTLSQITLEQIDVLSKEITQLSPWKELNYQTSILSKYLNHKQDTFYAYAISVDIELCGVICLHYPWLRGAYIELFAILPNMQHKGLGRNIIEWIEMQLIKEKHRNIWALVSEFNEPAINFYKNSGFNVIGKIEHLIQNNCNEIFIRKTIP